MTRSLRIVFAVALTCVAWPRAAEAGGPLGAQGQPIKTSKYTIDLFQGPVLAAARVISLGGAFTAIAEGTEGIPFNPASVSQRSPRSTTLDDYDLTFSVTLPSYVLDSDFDNNGDVRYTTKNFVWGTVGGNVQHGKLAFGVMLSAQNYVLGAPGASVPGSDEAINSVSLRLFRVDPVVSYAFMKDQLHVGAGVRGVGFWAVGSTRAQQLLFSTVAAGFQTGVLWTPFSMPMRVGATLRSPTVGGVDIGSAQIKQNAEGDRTVGDLYLPESVQLPWEMEAGLAVQLWKRPLNIPRWPLEDDVPLPDSERWRQTNAKGEREPPYLGARRMLLARYADIPRQKLLISTSVLVTGPVQNAVGIESMLSHTIDRSGQKTTASVRVGAEAEVIPFWLVLRAGSYLEPTRFTTSTYRVHATAGATLRLFTFDFFRVLDEGTVWRVSPALDISRNYFGWALGIGFFK